MNRRRSTFVLVAFASSWLACGDLLDLGPRPESWPPEGGLAPDTAPRDAARPAPEASTLRPAADAATLDAPEGAAPASDADVSFPAVGFVTGVSSPVAPTHPGATDWTNERLAATTLSCSGVLIASRTVLTAANCLANEALQTCFALNPTGDALAHPDHTMVYAVDAAHLSPGGQAILHLAVGSDQPEPATLATPIPPVTANDAMSSPFGLHSASLVQAISDGGPTTNSTASWRIENATTVVRRARGGTFVATGDADVELALTMPSPSSASDLGAPVFAQSGVAVVGSAYQVDDSALSFHTTFASAEGTWLEQMLWLYDEVIVPDLTPPSPPGAYAWIRLSDMAQDPSPLHDPFPTDFFAAGPEVVGDSSDSQTGSFGICVTWIQGEQLPGKFWFDGGCAYDCDGGECWPGVFKVLQVTGPSSWIAPTGSTLAAGSFAAGYAGTSQVFACRGSYMGGVDPGYVGQAGCTITWGGHEQVLTTFETLVLGP